MAVARLAAVATVDGLRKRQVLWLCLKEMGTYGHVKQARIIHVYCIPAGYQNPNLFKYNRTQQKHVISATLIITQTTHNMW